jgi:hypothetical protein
MTNAISQIVLEEILKAYAAGGQLPSPEAIRDLAGATAKSEQAVINEYARYNKSIWKMAGLALSPAQAGGLCFHTL